MAAEVRGVVAMAKGEPVATVTIVVPDPGPGEAVVRVQACGVCHTDLHYREGGINDDFPFLLGHEAAGVVESVGPDVVSVAPGDFVVLNWRAVCGVCRSCRRGRPWYCFDTYNATQKMTLTDGTPLSPALGIGAFAEKTLVAAGQCTKVDPAARPEAVGLLGCGVMAGLGAAMFTGEVGPGDSVAVFGCGGVGCAAVAGARLAGATTIIAIDLDPASWTWPGSSGPPRSSMPRPSRSGGGGAGPDRGQRRRRLHRGRGASQRHGAGVLRPGPGRDPGPGGRADPGHAHRPPDDRVLRPGRALKPSWYGDCLPSRDFPVLVDLYLQGRLDLDRFVSETIGLDDVEEAFHRMERGEVLRSVVVL